MAGFLKKKAGKTGKAVAKTGPVSGLKSWYQDRYYTAVAFKNFMIMITIVSLAAAAVSVLAVSLLSESKVFEPYLIQVEEKTGIITQVSGESVQRFTSDEIIKRYFMAKYIRARESYDPATYKYNYSTIVRLLSENSIYNQFQSSIAKENKDSPLNFGANIITEVFFKAMIPIEGGSQWQIRYSVRQYSMPSRQLVGSRHFISTLSFQFEEGLELSQEDRYINPLGFKVTAYRKDEEKMYKEGE